MEESEQPTATLSLTREECELIHAAANSYEPLRSEYREGFLRRFSEDAAKKADHRTTLTLNFQQLTILQRGLQEEVLNSENLIERLEALRVVLAQFRSNRC